MKRWIITTASISALALPLCGQVPTNNARLDDAKREADQRQAARREVLDLTGAAPAPQPTKVDEVRIGTIDQPAEVLILQANITKVFHLRIATAADTAKLITEAFGNAAPNAGGGGVMAVGGAAGAGVMVTNPFKLAAGNANQARVTATADERTNSVVVSGPGNLVNKVGSVIAELDGGKKEKVTYLGVITSSAAPALRDQLKLGKGVGLVVDNVEVKTAAETAGIKQHDVLEKLNDQLLINTEQFTAVLRTMKAGDEVTLSVIRQGERQSIKAKLGEKEIETTAGMAFGDFTQPVPPPVPLVAEFDRFDRGAITLDGRVNGVTVWNNQLDAGNRGKPVMAGNMVFRTVNGKQSTDWADDEFRISIERDGDKITKETVTDTKTGKVLMTGAPADPKSPVFETMPQLQAKIKKAEAAATAQPQIYLTGAAGVAPVNTARGKVVQWQDADHVMMIRLMANKPLYLLALSKKDGRTLYDGPVMTDEQRKSVPAEISEQFELLSAHPETAKEFGGPTNVAKAAPPAVSDPRPTTPPGGGTPPGSVPRYGAPAAVPATGAPAVLPPAAPAPAK